MSHNIPKYSRICKNVQDFNKRHEKFEMAQNWGVTVEAGEAVTTTNFFLPERFLEQHGQVRELEMDGLMKGRTDRYAYCNNSIDTYKCSLEDRCHSKTF